MKFYHLECLNIVIVAENEKQAKDYIIEMWDTQEKEEESIKEISKDFIVGATRNYNYGGYDEFTLGNLMNDDYYCRKELPFDIMLD